MYYFLILSVLATGQILERIQFEEYSRCEFVKAVVLEVNKTEEIPISARCVDSRGDALHNS